MIDQEQRVIAGFQQVISAHFYVFLGDCRHYARCRIDGTIIMIDLNELYLFTQVVEQKGFASTRSIAGRAKIDSQPQNLTAGSRACSRSFAAFD